MPSLPTRPLALRRGFVSRHALGAAIPTLVLAGLGIWALDLAREDAVRLRAQERVHAEGVRAEHAEVDIERDLSFFVFRARRYDVSWRDASGRAHRERVREHDVSIAPLVVEGPPDVRYLPSDPSRIAVGFARQNVGAQRAAIALLAGSGALLLSLGAWVLARATRRLREARSVARDARLAMADVITLERSYDSRGRATGELQLALSLASPSEEPRDTYRDRDLIRGPARGAPTQRIDAVTPADDPPLFLDPAGTRALVVVGRDGTAVLVRSSGHPFVLAESERRALLEGTHPTPATSTSARASAPSLAR